MSEPILFIEKSEGFATTLTEGLKIEHEAWRVRARQVTLEAIAV